MQANKKVAIIGAGIAGCSTAYALANRGFKVQIFERNSDIAGEASGNPSGLLYPRLSGAEIESSFALAAYLHSIAFYRSLKLSDDAMHFSGLLQLGFNERERERIAKVTQLFPSEVAQKVSAKVASELAGVTCEHEALFLPQAAYIQPKRICEALLQHHNISASTLTNIDNLLIKKDIFEIYANGKNISNADVVVIANANQAQHFLPNNALETIKVRGQLTLLNASQTSKKLKIPICTDGYLIPAVHDQHTLGATFSFDESPEVTEADHLENLEKLKWLSEDLYQHLQYQICGGRVAFRCASKDHMPLVGQMLDAQSLTAQPPRPSANPQSLPWIKNLYLNIGHGSHGFCSAPLAADMLASFISQQHVPINHKTAALLNPNRFLLKNMGLKKLAKTVACDWITE